VGGCGHIVKRVELSRKICHGQCQISLAIADGPFSWGGFCHLRGCEKTGG